MESGGVCFCVSSADVSLYWWPAEAIITLLLDRISGWFYWQLPCYLCTQVIHMSETLGSSIYSASLIPIPSYPASGFGWSPLKVWALIQKLYLKHLGFCVKSIKIINSSIFTPGTATGAAASLHTPGPPQMPTLWHCNSSERLQDLMF